MGKQYFAIQQAQREADIYIFGDIVTYEMLKGDVSGHGIVQQIKDLDVDRINVHIDSYGGVVSEGWAIYNALKTIRPKWSPTATALWPARPSTHLWRGRSGTLPTFRRTTSTR